MEAVRVYDSKNRHLHSSFIRELTVFKECAKLGLALPSLHDFSYFVITLENSTGKNIIDIRSVIKLELPQTKNTFNLGQIGNF